MEKIDITKLEGNQPAGDGEPQVPYEDIQMIAEKVNEIIEVVNKLLPCEHLETEVWNDFNVCKKCGVVMG